MARYIDADALIRVLNAKADIAMGTPKEVFFSVAKMVDYLPATDVVSKSEVAREIFEEIYEDCFDQFGYINYEALAELKKKYTEGAE